MGELLRHRTPDRQPARPGQLTLNDGWTAPQARIESTRAVVASRLCAGCRAREARYGFREGDEPFADRPRTFCFACFRVELARRQAASAWRARGWDAEQARLPLDDTLLELTRRRRRAQIAARHALGI
ncbi:MAG TPA: hypothetical protein VNI78_01995 [Vicinamibacterales bacterium]|nr:hypothetical protein [Vicinamibacterales bacterium]